MDTSETYIKMCEKTEEIQEKWKPQEGDWIVEKDLRDFPEVLKTGKRETDFVVSMNWNEEDFLNRNNSIWLPRQDQLQDLVGGLEREFIDFPKWLENVYGVNYGNSPNGHLHIFRTWEQLWFAFVMWELYQKKWDEEDWISDV